MEAEVTAQKEPRVRSHLDNKQQAHLPRRERLAERRHDLPAERDVVGEQHRQRVEVPEQRGHDAGCPDALLLPGQRDACVAELAAEEHLALLEDRLVESPALDGAGERRPRVGPDHGDLAAER